MLTGSYDRTPFLVIPKVALHLKFAAKVVLIISSLNGDEYCTHNYVDFLWISKKTRLITDHTLQFEYYLLLAREWQIIQIFTKYTYERKPSL